MKKPKDLTNSLEDRIREEAHKVLLSGGRYAKNKESKAFYDGAHFGHSLAMEEIESIRSDRDLLDEANIRLNEKLLTAQKQIEVLREGLNESRRYFLLMKVPPVFSPESNYDYKALWERDLVDASYGLKEVELALSKFKDME